MTGELDEELTVEAKDLDTEVELAFRSLFSSIEFLALVDIFSASIASHAEWSPVDAGIRYTHLDRVWDIHETNNLLFLAHSLHPDDL